MTSIQHLPYNPTADTIELADGSRWVREKTCHVVRDLGLNADDEREYEMACGSLLVRPVEEIMPYYCPWCGGWIVEKGATDGQ